MHETKLVVFHRYEDASLSWRSAFIVEYSQSLCSICSFIFQHYKIYLGGLYMSKHNDAGLFNWGDKNEYWGYRLVVTHNGKRKDVQKKYDDDGNPFKTKAAARKARELKSIETKELIKPKVKDVTLQHIWDYYLAHGTKRQRESTVRRYTSLWENHVKQQFANLYISEITTDALEEFLNDLYCSGLSYSYVEGFIKLYYLLFGLAHRINLMDNEQYVKMFVNKGSKVRMPKRTPEDNIKDEEVRALNSSEIAKIENLVYGTSFYIPFLLGYYCGLRLSEVYGLTWNDYNLFKNTLVINKQLTYSDKSKCFCLTSVKTLASYREVDIPTIVKVALDEQEALLQEAQRKNPTQWKSHASEIVLDKLKQGEVVEIQGGNFINRRLNGDLLTCNSTKRWVNKIKEIVPDFHFHMLRTTHITMLAQMNTPAIEVMKRVGHKKYETTMRYYISTTTQTHNVLLDNIEQITTEEIHRPISINGIDIDATDDFIHKLKNLVRVEANHNCD